MTLSILIPTLAIAVVLFASLANNYYEQRHGDVRQQKSRLKMLFIIMVLIFPKQ
ncbi:MAG: hypothetical protein ACTS85_02475 [Arsenophonus sp. NC-PG7-MAG3]